VQADKIILATGSEPALLPMFDFDQPTILTSTSALQLETIPSSLLIVGAGAIGCEFASIFAELGTNITMVEMMPQMLPLEDRRIAKQFQNVYRKRGIQVLVKTRVERVAEYADDHVVAVLSNGSEVTADKILVSVGRTPNSTGMGLQATGVETDARGYVVVNDFLETTAPDIYAFGSGRKRDLRSTPSCTYSIPEVASVGLSEEHALDYGYEPVTGTYRFAALGKALALGDTVGFVQLVADRDSDLLLGASIMGPHATDIVHEIALAIQGGLTARQLGETIHAHPTIAEAVMEAAHDLHGESVHVAREPTNRGQRGRTDS
jgi:dihydrolipoamide dehydrogenase